MWAEAGTDKFTLRMTPLLRHVSIATRIVMKMINEIFVYRKTHDNRINFLEAFVWYYMRQGIKIDLAYLIMNHMVHVSGFETEEEKVIRRSKKGKDKVA